MLPILRFHKPIDDSMGGSSELSLHEIQLEQLGIGGDFHYDNVARQIHDSIWHVFQQPRPANDQLRQGEWNNQR